MKANKLLFIFPCIMLFCKTLNAQQSPEEISKQFFDKYKTEGSDKALDFLLQKNKYETEFKGSADELKKKLKNILAIIGQFTGYELLTKKTAGGCIVMLTFLAKHEKDALTFRIAYYKPDNIWQFQDFKFNTNIEEELEEASRAYRFKENLDN